MECPRCHAANADGARFCGECGASLTRDATCSGCGHLNPPGQKFCNGCGQPLGASAPAATRDPSAYTPKHLAEKILTSRTALEGERKQVTVLFADVKGSMELAEQVDPEAWHRIMDRFFHLLADGVHRFEGTVVQFTGDGIMALFGAPIAHEDHAQRACWAALHLGEGLRRYADELRIAQALNFSVRMGLNSGEVVVGRIGDDLRMDYTAIGHTVGLAQRMEQLAAADRVYLTEHTARLVEGYFRLRDLGALAVKGASGTVRVFELEGAGALRTRLDASRARGFTRFVGRADEFAALEAALGRTVAGQGQVLGVVAEPGIGKSRLCWEFAQRARARGIPVYEGHGVAHGKAIPLLPVLELLRNVHGVTDHDSPQAAREKIAGKLLLLDEGLRDSLPFVFDLHGVPDPERPAPRMEPEARQRLLFAVVKRVVQARSRREPAVWLIEDLHWLDAASEAFIEMAVEATAGTRTLLLLNFRPEYHAAWMQRVHYQQLPLLPLGPEAAAELLRDLLGSAQALEPLSALIRERTAGNPFFAEEVVQALVESGAIGGERGAYNLLRPVDALAIPANVQAVLAGRIDRLAEREKRVLQTAAVIGREFAELVLARVGELPEAELSAALRALMASEFVYEEALYPDAVYAFKHPLTQEVAYGSQLGERRRQVHAAVARAVEAIYPTKLDEQAALLAHNWEEAGEALRATTWHRRAAEWLGVRDRREARRHWQRVRALLDTLPESPETLALGVLARDRILFHGTMLGTPEDEAARVFAEGLDLAARLPDPAPRIGFLMRYGVTRTLSGALEEARPLIEEAVRLADRSGDRLLRFQSRMAMVHPLINGGELNECLRILPELEALSRGDPEFAAAYYGFSPYGWTMGTLARALSPLGRPAEARRAYERALEIARARGDNELLCMIHGVALGVCEMLGDREAALDHARQGIELADATGFLRGFARAGMGRALLMHGHGRQAVAFLEEALAIVRELRVGLIDEGWHLATLAEAYLLAGEVVRARETADLAVSVARRRGTRLHEIIAHLARAHVLLATDSATDAPAIAATLDDAAALVDATAARGWAPPIHAARARLARLRGDEATCARELELARRLCIEMGAPARAEQLTWELGSSAESTSGISSTSRT